VQTAVTVTLSTRGEPLSVSIQSLSSHSATRRVEGQLPGRRAGRAVIRAKLLFNYRDRVPPHAKLTVYGRWQGVEVCLVHAAAFFSENLTDEQIDTVVRTDSELLSSHADCFFGTTSKLISFPSHFLPDCFRLSSVQRVYSSGSAVLYLSHSK